MVFNATFINISVILWQSVLLVEDKVDSSGVASIEATEVVVSVKK